MEEEIRGKIVGIDNEILELTSFLRHLREEPFSLLNDFLRFMPYPAQWDSFVGLVHNLPYLQFTNDIFLPFVKNYHKAKYSALRKLVRAFVGNAKTNRPIPDAMLVCVLVMELQYDIYDVFIESIGPLVLRIFHHHDAAKGEEFARQLVSMDEELHTHAKIFLTLTQALAHNKTVDISSMQTSFLNFHNKFIQVLKQLVRILQLAIEQVEGELKKHEETRASLMGQLRQIPPKGASAALLAPSRSQREGDIVDLKKVRAAQAALYKERAAQLFARLDRIENFSRRGLKISLDLDRGLLLIEPKDKSSRPRLLQVSDAKTTEGKTLVSEINTAIALPKA